MQSGLNENRTSKTKACYIYIRYISPTLTVYLITAGKCYMLLYFAVDVLQIVHFILK